MKKFLVISLMCLICVSCESDEQDKLAQAQDCLDNVSSSNPSAASSCMSYVNDMDSEQANIIKCSIKFVAGGLTTAKISEAYKQLKDNANQDKEALYISILSLNPASLATDAAAYCKKSGVKGLIYLANLSVVGSQLMAILPGGIPANPTAQDAQDALDACKASPNTCDDTAIGNAVVAVADSYCGSSNADSDICTKVNDAIAAAGGVPADIAQQLYLLLDN